MARFRHFRPLTAVVSVTMAALLLTACGGSSSSSPRAPAEGATLGGGAAKGIVRNAVVEAFPADDAEASPLATAFTDPVNGTYSLALPSGTQGAVRLLLRAPTPEERGERDAATVVCDAPVCVPAVGETPAVVFGQAYPLTFEMSSLVQVDATSLTVGAAITPLTTLVERHYAGQPSGVRNVRASNNVVRNLLGLARDPALMQPVDLTVANNQADIADVRDTLLNASFAVLAAQEGGNFSAVIAALETDLAANSLQRDSIDQLAGAISDVRDAVNVEINGLDVAATLASEPVNAVLESCVPGACVADAELDIPEDAVAEAKQFVARLRGVVEDFINTYLDNDNNFEVRDTVRARLDDVGHVANLLVDEDDDLNGMPNDFGEAAVAMAVHLLIGDGENISLEDALTQMFDFFEDGLEGRDIDTAAGTVVVSGDGETATLSAGSLRGATLNISVGLADVMADLDEELVTIGPVFTASLGGTAQRSGNQFEVDDETRLLIRLNEAFELPLGDNELEGDFPPATLVLEEVDFRGGLTISRGATPGVEAGAFTGNFRLQLVRNASLAGAIGDELDLEGDAEGATLARQLLIVPRVLTLSGDFQAGETNFRASFALQLDNVGSFEVTDLEDVAVNEDAENFLAGTFSLNTFARLANNLPAGDITLVATRTGFLNAEFSLTAVLGNDTIRFRTELDSDADSLADALADADLPLITIDDTQGMSIQIDPNRGAGVIMRDGADLGTVRDENGTLLISWRDGSIETLY
ncbi:MAG: hypothetical protein C0462_11650 [Alcanivorax sp.]|nr:hypothetical protein [Alcanivorax sp.]